MEEIETTDIKIAKALLKIKAVFLRPSEPFIWASGIKSPIYCDNRLILTDPKVRELVESSLAESLAKNFPDAQILMGTATAGIAHAAIMAHILGLPMGYVRGASKDHGRKNLIEGRLSPGQKVVVVEDLISTAQSAVSTARALKDAGAKVLGVISIFTYGMDSGIKNLEDIGLKNHSLTNLDAVIKVGVEEGYITKDEGNKLILFRTNPEDESWMGANL